MAYQLYFNKENYIIEVKPLQAVFKNIEVTDEVRQYNDRYYFCNKRKALKEKALEIKSQWQQEVEDELNKIKNIEIK